MKIAIIGRSEYLYETVKLLLKNKFIIPIIITSKEAPEYKKTLKDFKKLAKKINARFIYSKDIHKNINEIKSENCKIAISCNHTSVISKKIIDLFPLGILNAHGGDLPKYRGNACQAWAILNGEKKIGLCVHSMLGGQLDSGKIISREYMNININTKITDCIDWMSDQIPNLFLKSIRKLKKNKNFFLKKNHNKHKSAFRCYPRIPEDGKINWSRSNNEILRVINASNKPYSGAYCFYKNKKLIVWDAELFDDNEKYLSECGQISAIQKNSIIVITGNGKLKIKKIEYQRYIGEPTKKIKSIRFRLN